MKTRGDLQAQAGLGSDVEMTSSGQVDQTNHFHQQIFEGSPRYRHPINARLYFDASPPSPTLRVTPPSMRTWLSATGDLFMFRPSAPPVKQGSGGLPDTTLFHPFVRYFVHPDIRRLSVIFGLSW